MTNIFVQTGTVLSINLKGLASRKGLVAATMVCVALVVATLLGLDALTHGLKRTLEQSGDPAVALIMRGGSQAEINSVITREQLDILRGAQGVGPISPEVNLVVDGYRLEDGERTNISMRGITENGVTLRRGAGLIAGRWPKASAAELVVGARIAEGYKGMAIGETIEFGSANWRIVGHFETDGDIFESEIWGDLTAVQNLFERENVVQSVRTKSGGPEGLASLSALSEKDPRLQLSVKSEAEYYALQASRTSELAQYLAWPLAILMAVGAVIGAINTMLSSVASRSTEIATLRVLGYRRFAVFSSLMIECVIICTLAGLIGAGLSYLFLDGLSASTLGGGITSIGYSLEFTLLGVLQGVVLAVVIGILGAFFPAMMASLRPLTEYLSG
ncbi:MAG: ABC transporter permease [Pseudomonadota bacterium]